MFAHRHYKAIAMRYDDFTRAYITCALWSSTDESTPDGGEFMDANYGPEDLAPATLATMAKECAEFQSAYAELLAQAYDLYAVEEWSPQERAGHDFWLTRNGHGAGFWARSLPKVLGDALTTAAHLSGTCDLYVGDDGQIYL